MNFKLLAAAALAGAAMADCPADSAVLIAKQLTSNLVNAVNQKNIGLMIDAIASTDATAKVNGHDQRGVCVSLEEPYAMFASQAIASNRKFVQANITDAFQTHVGYTVVKIRALGDDGLYTQHEYQYMDPTGTCNLQLIYYQVDEERCL